MKGSPTWFLGHEQIALWFITRHSAFCPQLSIHGSTHFLLKQPLSGGQSEFAMHSGRQAGGEPIFPCIQEQTAWPLDSLQLEKGPQGDGEQGFIGVWGIK